MNDSHITYILFGISQVILLSCLGGLYLLWKKGQFLESRIKHLESDVTALSLGALGVSKYLDAMAEKQKNFVENQVEQRPSAPLLLNDAEKLYQSAISLVKEGASVDELVSQCHLAREEAELIKMIHSLDQK